MARPTLLLASLALARAHVSLTFPPARNFDLDFLDSARTKAPCGMPKGTERTMLKAGTSVNITWHLAYPHRGGFRLEVLDPKERPLRSLTPTQHGHNFLTGDPTAQHYVVSLPSDLQCVDCSIRLVRQASEWGKPYQFWSCADVDIMPPNNFVQVCSGHGKAFSGRCRCERNYHGDVCQYQDECREDVDCGGHGRCHDIGATSYPRHQCYCEAGYFGPGCSRKSHSKTRQLQEGLYTRRDLSEKLTLYWRILQEAQEVEMVLRLNGTSWAAVGWRPAGLTSSCRKFPVLADQEPVARSIDFGESAVPEPEAQVQPRTGRAKKVEKRMTTSVDVGISYVMSSVSSSRRRRAAETKEEVKKRLRETLLSRRRFQRAFAVPLNGRSEETSPASIAVEPEPETTPAAEPEPEVEPESEPEAESEPEPETEPEPESEPEAESEPEPRAEPATPGGSSWTPRGGFHGMDCTDMVVGMARGSTHRIADFYTRDRSTPRRDSFWSGEDDLRSAAGWEEDGITTLVFRKPLQANGPTDHDIMEEEMHVIWATGQEQGMYSHSPASGLEAKGEEPSVPDFYKDDELKYHGKANRGVTRINFRDEVKRNDQSRLDYCGGEWDYPRGCVQDGLPCQYLARWQFNEDTDKINFTISSRNPEKKNKWTGIGFSDTPSMRLTDAIIGWVEPNGRTFIMDMWTTNYLNPILESKQDITDMSGTLEDDVTTLRFTRARNTSDKQDVAFTDTEGMYMIFPVKGGFYNGVNKKIRKHEQVPIVSTERIFIKSCRTADGRPTFTTTPKPPQLVYPASMKFVNTGNYQLPRPDTEEFTKLQERISRSLRQTELRQVPGFLDVAVTRFFSRQDGEFNAEMLVIVDQATFESEAEPLTVKQALTKAVARKRIGTLQVEPSSLSLDQSFTDGGADEGRDLKVAETPNVKLYVVVACIAALVLVAIIQASCTIFKMSRRGSSVHKEKLLGQSQWKDYSAGGHPAPHHPPYHYNDSFEAEGDTKGGWQHHRGAYERQHPGHHTASLPRPPAQHGHQPAGHPLGYSSFDRRGGGYGQRAAAHHHPAPDHYFMPSQRRHHGDALRVYVDYNK